MQPECWDFELGSELSATRKHLLVRNQQILQLQAWPAAAATCCSAVSFAAMACAAPSAVLVTGTAKSYQAPGLADFAPTFPTKTAGTAETGSSSSSDASSDDDYYHFMTQETRDWRALSRQVGAVC